MSRYVPLKGHPFHNKSDASLRFITKDAGEAARCAHGLGDRDAESKYLDQVNDACTILRYRQDLHISK